MVIQTSATKIPGYQLSEPSPYLSPRRVSIDRRMNQSTRTWLCVGCGAEMLDTQQPAQWCPSCGAVGLWRAAHRRPLGDTLASRGRTWSAAQVVQTAWTVRSCGATGLPWSAPCLATLTGPPGSGKSTLALQIAAGLSPVLLVSAEESPGPALARRLVLAGMGGRGDVSVVRQLDAGAMADEAAKGGAIVVDSVTATWLQSSDLRALCDAGANLVLGVVQVTKDNRMAGPRALEHEADLVIRVEDGHWTVTKSRFGPAAVTGSIRGVAKDDQPEIPPKTQEVK